MKLVVDRTDDLADDSQCRKPFCHTTSLATTSLSTTSLCSTSLATTARQLYHAVLMDPHSEAALQGSRQLLNRLLDDVDFEGDLPSHPQHLLAWTQQSATKVADQYRAYLAARKGGQPRAYFSTRGHALYFLRRVAFTKLVDGAWLYGTVRHWQHSRYWPLIHTYLEELGCGEPAQNHVRLYKQLLLSEGCDGDLDDLDDACYLQGAVQLALGCQSDRFWPEVIGYNLGYEQLPLHLLITAYELKELGIDPYYFTLHVTVDNAANGHARRAVQAVLDNWPVDKGAEKDSGKSTDYYRRVMRGYALNNAGVGSLAIIEAFDHYSEVVAIIKRKSPLAQLHSDYNQIRGRSVNEWLADPEQVPQFLAALAERGWIKPDRDPEVSPFWNLLQGPKACMAGVFSPYELTILYEWIAGSWLGGKAGSTPRFQARAAKTGAAVRPENAWSRSRSFNRSFNRAVHECADGWDDLNHWMAAMAPGRHDTPEGLSATRHFHHFFIASGNPV